MRRPEFTPSTWYSEDKTLMFRMDRYGITDILPGPNAGVFKWIQANYGRKPFSSKLKLPSAPEHIHWAFDKKEKQ